ncbi:unnamed protein product [Peniophora sp. CBMAI 1063]|nr:unnamed protein product [Peniophora sp. CBMAI 1063]
MPTPTLSIFPRGPGKPYNELSRQERLDRMGAWFLGNRGENARIFQESMASIIWDVQSARQEIWSNDSETITTATKKSPEFKASVAHLEGCLSALATELSATSVPFHSLRNAGHTSTDSSVPALLGYALAQLYNQDSASSEAGSFTDYIEYTVAQQLCHILGYTLDSTGPAPARPSHNDVFGWGHITADSSIANLESMLIARNLKYYPLSLHKAMDEDPSLKIVQTTFTIRLRTSSEPKLFYDCTSWELLNLDSLTIARIPGQLYERYNISSEALSDIVRPFSIHTLGMERLDAEFGITKPPVYFVSVANRHSWSKGCAITGSGSGNLIELGVDGDMRMDVNELKGRLDTCLRKQQAVFCVVAVCGTTEHGAVDPVNAIVGLREDMARRGLSFMIHADAALGGYLACKVHRATLQVPSDRKRDAHAIGLSPWTHAQLGGLSSVDSVTVDPLKSGYASCPAGVLCMRDSRLRFLTHWTSTSGADYDAGTYIERSKPGAAAVSILLSHEVIGLERDDEGGYAHLLGTAMLTAIKMYCHWVTMDLTSDRLVVTAINRLPVERKDNASGDEILQQKRDILEQIVGRANEDLEEDADVMRLLCQLGSDTVVNAFVCNFRLEAGGAINDDVAEANFLNQRLHDRLSVHRRSQDVITDRPIILNRVGFKASTYKGALDTLKTRMKVKGPGDLVALSSVTMHPFPVAETLLSGMVTEFRKVAEEEITNCLVRVKPRRSIHGFILQGLHAGSQSGVYSAHLVYLPMFHIKNHQRQLILRVSVKLEKAQTEKINGKRSSVLTVHTSCKTLQGLSTLDEVLAKGSFEADIYEGFPDIYASQWSLLSDVKFTFRREQDILVNQSLASSGDYDSAIKYPEKTPFYVYAHANQSVNIDHVLTMAPNVQLSAAGAVLSLVPPTRLDPSVGLYKLTLDDYVERTMHPFSGAGFFTPGRKLRVTVRGDDKSNFEGHGTLELPAQLHVDYAFLNQEMAADVYIVAPASSAHGSETVRTLAGYLVQAFRTGEIEWTGNVVVAFNKYLEKRQHSLPTGYSITLGVPTSLPKEVGSYKFVVVSRFVCKQPSSARSQSFARGQTWAEKYPGKI